MVKSLLLGGAAGIVAVAGAQGADFPVKAKAPAVQYVKICSLYGAGFYYIPGTDTCLKIGGYIRTQIEWHAGGGGIAVGTGGAERTQGKLDRVDTNDTNYRDRAVVTFDTRTQGEYGTLRSYYRVGWAVESPATSSAGTTANAYWDRAFIQFAGFTVGKAQSFFDLFNHGGHMNYINTRTSGDNGAAGLMMWAYTAQFGNGFSATISAEDPRGHNLFGVTDLNTSPFVFAATPTTDNGLANNAGTGFQIPDIIFNARVDQQWGYFGVSLALHQVAAGYYSPNLVSSGHPSDKWGVAVGVGGQWNIPGTIRDKVGANFVYSEGAVGYPSGAATNGMLLYNTSSRVAQIWGVDAVFALPGTIPGYGGDLELTKAWAFNAGYEHGWTPALRTSIYGGYVQVNYGGTARALICATSSGNLGLTGTTNPCNPDYSFWQVGTRTQWAPWKGQLNIGVDLFYTKINTAFAGPANLPASAPRPAVSAAAGGRYEDQDTFGVAFRVQRNWYP